MPDALNNKILELKPQSFAQKMLAENRIHFEHGSSFLEIGLAIHPRELLPENEGKLREKLYQNISYADPQDFHYHQGGAVAKALRKLIPVSSEAEAKQRQTTSSNEFAERRSRSFHEPFTTLLQRYLGTPNPADRNPEWEEKSANSIAAYYILEQALFQKGYTKPLHEMLHPPYYTVEAVLGQLAPHLGIDVRTVEEAARKGGLEGFAQALGSEKDDLYIKELIEVCRKLPEVGFSYNHFYNWKIGFVYDYAERQQNPAIPARSIDEKIELGKKARVDATIEMQRHSRLENFSVPEAIAENEKHLAGLLETYIPKPLLEALYEIGAEFCITSAKTVTPISGALFNEKRAEELKISANRHDNEYSLAPVIEQQDIDTKDAAYGFFRKISHNRETPEGQYHIYLSNWGNHEQFIKTMVHEVNHLIFPNIFTKHPDWIGEINDLTAKGAGRIKALQVEMKKWEMDSSPENTKVVIEALDAIGQVVIDAHDGIDHSFINMINQYPGVSAFTKQITDKRLPGTKVKDTTEGYYETVQVMKQMVSMVNRAGHNLMVDSPSFMQILSYQDVETKFSEIIPRYAELREDRLSNAKGMLEFISPEFTKVYDQYYIPHIEEQLSEFRAKKVQPIQAASPKGQRAKAAEIADGEVPSSQIQIDALRDILEQLQSASQGRVA